jgi:hypothetical protein
VPTDTADQRLLALVLVSLVWLGVALPAEDGLKILAIDPGTTESAFVLWQSEPGFVLDHGKHPNELVLRLPTANYNPGDAVVIEMIEGYGMAVGKEVFETLVWIGRYLERYTAQCHVGVFVERLSRRDVKLEMCGSARAKDAEVRQAAIDRAGPPSTTVDTIGPKGGRKRTVVPGPTYGLAADEWQCLALALAWYSLRVVTYRQPISHEPIHAG